MEQLATGWQMNVTDRGPDWLFIRLQIDRESCYEAPGVADRLWSVLQRHFIYRLVLEMDEVEFLSSHLLGQLVMIQKRVLQHGGALRLCGLTSSCRDVLRQCRLMTILPAYESRTDAVLGRATVKPR